MSAADSEERAHAPRDCPKYDSCSVAICPLDALWHKRGVAEGEAVCPYLLDLDKPGDPVARFAGRYDAFVIEAAIRLRAALAAHPHPRYVYILKRIEASAETPNMIEQAEATARRFAERRQKKGVCEVLQKESQTETPAGGSPGATT